MRPRPEPSTRRDATTGIAKATQAYLLYVRGPSDVDDPRFWRLGLPPYVENRTRTSTGRTNRWPHALMMTAVGVPALMALLLEINASTVILALSAWFRGARGHRDLGRRLRRRFAVRSPRLSNTSTASSKCCPSCRCPISFSACTGTRCSACLAKESNPSRLRDPPQEVSDPHPHLSACGNRRYAHDVPSRTLCGGVAALLPRRSYAYCPTRRPKSANRARRSAGSPRESATLPSATLL